MTVLLQVSDPHFGTERPLAVEALVRLARAQAPDLLLLSGDITQRARRSQFKAARGFVDRIGAAATLAIPGNHDIPLFNPLLRFFAPYANHCRVFGPELEPVHESDGMLVIGLNTTRSYRHKHGEVSGAQIERVAQRLRRAAPGQLRLVVTHQPVAVTRPEDRVNLLRGHGEAVRRWSAAGADLILGGHIHLPFLLPLHERFGDLPRPVWAVQAGTAVSWRIRREAGNSVNLIRRTSRGAQRPGAVVERWDFCEEEQRFHAVAIDELVFAEAG